MSIEAINEQLLRAIGVGVALIELDKYTVQFRNDTFNEWFGDNDTATTLPDFFPSLDVTSWRGRCRKAVGTRLKPRSN